MANDILVVGAGPAALAIAAALCDQGLRVAGLAPDAPEAPWRQTYGIWRDEAAALGLAHTLAHAWEDSSVYTSLGQLPLGRTYALFENRRLQAHLLGRCQRAGMRWQRGAAAAASHDSHGSTVTSATGDEHAARLVIDASGHNPALLRRPAARDLAYQAAYGIVATIERPPVRAGRCVLMDYRAEHLPAAERAGPPTFLYAMDLGGGRYFVEETSLAHAPGLKLALLERRLYRRLAWLGALPEQILHVERCLFPMNPPLPDLRQSVVGYGAAAGMVHPASGYSVGASLRRAPQVAAAVAAALGRTAGHPRVVAEAAWEALWPAERQRKHQLYLFGLASLLGCNTAQLQGFFQIFYRLPQQQWAGYLADTLPPSGVAATMLRLFLAAPPALRLALAGAAWRERALLTEAFGA
jgi:lycopene beta-cyclase